MNGNAAKKFCRAVLKCGKVAKNIVKNVFTDDVFPKNPKKFPTKCYCN